MNSGDANGIKLQSAEMPVANVIAPVESPEPHVVGEARNLKDGKALKFDCESVAGCAWAQLALEPPKWQVDGYSGYPDNNNMSTTKVTQRGVKEVTLLDSSGQPADQYLMLVVGGLRSPALGIKYDDTGIVDLTGGFDLAAPVYQNSTYNPNNLPADVAEARKAFGSLTIYQDETAFSNRGIISVAKFRPEWVELTLAGASVEDALTRWASGKTGSAKPKFLGERPDSDFEVLSRETRRGVATPPALPSASPATARILVVPRLPVNATDVLSLSAKSYTGMLRDGAYIVHNNTQPVNEYEVNLTPGDATVGSAYYLYVQNLNTFLPFNRTFPFSANMAEYVSKSWSCAWVHFGNMKSGDNSGNHIVLKNFDGFEFAPQPGSSLQTFMTACALEDQRALRLVNQTMHAAPDALTAKDNSWGTLLSAAAQALPSVASWFSNVFKTDEPKALKAKKKVATAERSELANEERSIAQSAAEKAVNKSVAKAAGPSALALAQAKLKKKTAMASRAKK